MGLKKTKSEKDTALFCSFRASYLSDVSSCVLKCHQFTKFCQKATLCRRKLMIGICYQNAYLLLNRCLKIIVKNEWTEWRHSKMEALLCNYNPYLKNVIKEKRRSPMGKKVLPTLKNSLSIGVTGALVENVPICYHKCVFATVANTNRAYLHSKMNIFTTVASINSQFSNRNKYTLPLGIPEREFCCFRYLSQVFP